MNTILHHAIERKLQEIDTCILSKTNEDNISLLCGEGGIALYLFYRFAQTQNEDCRELAYKKLNTIISRINDNIAYPTFADGLAGFGWLFEHLNNQGFIKVNINKFLADIDVHLFSVMNESKHYDYLHSTSGYAFYYISRYKNNNDVGKYLMKYLDWLNDSSISESDTIRWKSILSKEKNLKGFNFGLAHGIPSIICILLKIRKLGINVSLCDKLLNGSVGYLMNNAFETQKYGSFFPNWISEDAQTIRSRLAWCYGDLGVAISLYFYAKQFGRQDVLDFAIKVLLYSTQRIKDDDTQVLDACLCHGSSGIMHIFNRLYSDTKYEQFSKATDFWAQKTIDIAHYPNGLAGYKTWRSQEFGGLQNNCSFLEGIAGIGISLISYISDIEPAWDECLLLS